MTKYTKYTHGEAVAIGMVYAAIIGELTHTTPFGTSDRIRNVLVRWNLPDRIDLRADELFHAMLSDKKKLSGKIYFVLLRKIGEAATFPMTSEELNKHLIDALARSEK